MRRTPSNSRNLRAGFTLLEVLLTVMLSMVLLAGLWSLSNIYLRTFDRGQDLIEEAQLLRAIQQQVSDDLQALVVRPKIEGGHAEWSAEQEGAFVSSPGVLPGSEAVVDAYVPLPTSFSGGSPGATLPVYSLSGSETSMKLIVMRDVFVTGKQDEAELDLNMPGESSEPREPELRVVWYQFVPRDEDEFSTESTADEELITGLARREIAWEDLIGNETPDDLLMQTEETSDIETSELASEYELETPVETEEEREALKGKEERIDLPQIVSCRFRYFDGSMWRSSWESGSTRELPVALEVMLQIEPTGAAQRERIRREQESLVETSQEDEENTVLQEPELETKGDWPVHRQVFFLPNGGSRDRSHRRPPAPESPDRFPAEGTEGDAFAESPRSLGEVNLP